jgi:hypothetical protein
MGKNICFVEPIVGIAKGLTWIAIQLILEIVIPKFNFISHNQPQKCYNKI